MKIEKLICIGITYAAASMMLVGCSDEYDEYYENLENNPYDYSEDYDEDTFDFWDDDYEDEYEEYEDYYSDDSYYEDDSYYNEYESYEGYASESEYDLYYPVDSRLPVEDFPLGTCREMDGRTILVSICMDDSNCSWPSKQDEMIYDALEYTGIAANWLSDSVSEYGCNAEFIYDWTENSDLFYEGYVDIDMTAVDREGDYIDYAAWQFIDENIDSKALLEKYEADNIAFLFLLNTPKHNNVTSCTRNYYDGMAYPYEMCYMYMRCDNEEETPAAFAHEILHTFGAPDLYTEDSDGGNYGIPRELVTELERAGSNDIMFTTYDAWKQTPYYDRITNVLSDVDAYYVGILEQCDFVDEWGLEPSQH